MDIKFDTTNLLVLFAAILLATLFHYVPQIDIYFSHLFFDYNTNTFSLKDNFLIRFIYQGVKVACVLVTIALFYLIYRIYQQTGSFSPLTYFKIIYFILVIALGPGIIIHEVIKENVDRPRPRHIQEFGGEREFEPVFATNSFLKEHKGGFSFVSGHSAVGFMFFGLAFLSTGARRKKIFIFSTLAGLSIGLVRIAQGGHFLSDVIFAGFTVYFTALLLGVFMSKLFFLLEHQKHAN